MNAPWPGHALRIPVRQNALLARMEPDELAQIKRDLRCTSDRELGERIGVSRFAVFTWRRGQVQVPAHIAMLLRMLAAESAY